jgi:hypothetical protein
LLRSAGFPRLSGRGSTPGAVKKGRRAAGANIDYAGLRREYDRVVNEPAERRLNQFLEGLGGTVVVG